MSEFTNSLDKSVQSIENESYDSTYGVSNVLPVGEFSGALKRLQMDTSGNLKVTGGGGGTQYAIGAVAGATDTGTTALAIRDDALTTLADADGDWVALRVSSTGALHVTGAGGGTEYTEDVATANPIVGTAVMMERDDALGGLTPAEGDWAGLRCDANGALWTHDDALDACVSGSEMQVDVVAALPAGSNAIGKLAANSGVDIGDVDVTSIVPGVGATNLGKAIDTATGATDTGVLALATRDDALGGLTEAAGDNVQLRVDANGALWTRDDILEAVIDGAYLNVNANIAGTDIVGGAGVLAAGVQRVTIATDDECNNLLGTIDADTSTIAGDTTSIDGKITACNTGAVVLAAGTAAVGTVGIDATTNAQGATYHFDADGDNTAQQIKASGGNLYSISISNINAADAFLQLYDESGAITVGTTTPKMSILIPAGDATLYGSRDITYTVPVAFTNSIKYACTNTPTGNGDPAVGLVVNATFI